MAEVNKIVAEVEHTLVQSLFGSFPLLYSHSFIPLQPVDIIVSDQTGQGNDDDAEDGNNKRMSRVSAVGLKYEPFSFGWINKFGGRRMCPE